MLLVASGILATFLTTSAILSKMVCDGITIIIVQLDEILHNSLADRHAFLAEHWLHY